MKLQHECLKCIFAQVETVTDMLGFDEARRESVLRETRDFLSKADYENCTPESMGSLWSLLLRDAETDDPYQTIKSRCNAEAEKMADQTRRAIASADDPFTVALKYAIAGNLIDFGLARPVPVEEQNERIRAVVTAPFAIDHSDLLRGALRTAKRLLYLCDNAGEIVFDRLLLERVRSDYPALEIVCGVRGKPILNDATMSDALEAGMDAVARVIDNGDGSPGTVLKKTSPAFREEFERADVVVSKGQGNFESLWGEEKEHLYFLFMAKCNSICRVVNVKQMCIVCLKNNEHDVK